MYSVWGVFIFENYLFDEKIKKEVICNLSEFVSVGFIGLVYVNVF